MTQIDHGTIEMAPADAGWRDFGSWLASKRLILCGLVLVGGQVALNTYVLTRGYFQLDDFSIGGLSAHSFTLHMLFQNYSGQLMPAVFAVAWALTHTGGGYDWGLWAGTLVAMQALAGLALLRALRTLFGDRMTLLIPLAIFLFTPMAMSDLSWWAAGIQSVPIQLAIALAVDQHVRYVRYGRTRNVVFATVWILFGLAFYEKSVAIPLLLFALTSAFLTSGSWARGMLETLRKHWRAWVLYAGTIIAEIIVYALSLQASTARVRVPEASTAVSFGWGLIRSTFVPAILGGPWRWTLPHGAPRSWALYALASTPGALEALAWVAFVAIVVASLWYRREAWRAWLILLGWLVIADIGPIILGRVAYFGTLLSGQAMYVADAAPVLAICGALAFLPLRGEENAYRTDLPLRWRHGWRWAGVLAVATTLTAAFGAGSVWSYSTYRNQLHPQNTRSYLATASAALHGVAPNAVIYPSQIPNQMAWTLLGAPTQVQNALAPLADQVTGQDFQWGTPTGLAPWFMVFDAQGRLHPAVVTGPHSLPFRPKSACVLHPTGIQLPLTGQVYPLPFVMQIGYYSGRPVTLAVTFGGHQYQLSLPSTSLAYGYLPVTGPGNSVGIRPVTPNPGICLGTVTVGNVEPSSSEFPVPAFPRRG